MHTQSSTENSTESSTENHTENHTVNSSERLVTTVVTEEELTRLFDLFVPVEAPYFFEATNVEMTTALLKAGLVVYAIGEFFANFPEWIKGYAYPLHVWMMDGELNVLFADAKRFALLDTAMQQALLRKQVQVGRGHVFQEEWLHALAEQLPQGQQRSEVLATLEQQGWLFADESSGLGEGRRVVFLTTELWQHLSLDVKKAWLLKWLTEETQEQGEAAPLLPAEWQVRPQVAELVLQYAGYFPTGLAANCFAAALGIAIGKQDATEAVIQRWLHEGPFLRSLHALGYERVGAHDAQDQSFPLRGEDVLVWVKADGQGIHAAYVLAPDVIFQKAGQSWPQPWRVIRLAGMRDYAGTLTQGGRIEFYRRLNGESEALVDD